MTMTAKPTPSRPSPEPEMPSVPADWPWPRYARYDGKVEYRCPHEIGHGGVHGCDGCCADPRFPGRTDDDA